MGAYTQNVIADAIRDAQKGGGPYAASILPAAVSAAMTSASLGGLLQRLFGFTYDTREQFYFYQPTDYPLTTNASAGGTAATQIIITQDADFIASKITYVVGDDGTAARDQKVQLIFSNNDRQWSSQQGGIHALAIGGTGQLPYILPKPWLISRNSRINVTITSITANARAVYADLHGFKVLDVSSLDLTTRRA